ncbi:MAG TPA: hypothetical protein PK152_03345 [Anaerolineales bacterium]|nr:hypothetical protein [Anaerolineales bacterium]
MKKIHPAFLLLLAAIAAYGLLIPQLGFYWDDLPMSWIRYQLGRQAMTEYFSTNRPVWAWLYQVTTSILPHQPIYWQVFALFWRWAGALTVWAIARRLFPQRATFALTLSLFFLLYPGFNQQWGSYLYSHFFIVLFFFLFSIHLMLRGKTLPALLFSALNLWMMEYFFVLELIRPFVIWVSLPVDSNRFKTTLRQWVPYLGVFALAVLSRIFIFNNQIYQFSIREELAKAPFETLSLLVGNVFSSLWAVTLSAWALIFRFPSSAIDGPRTVALYIFVVMLVAAVAMFGLRNQSQSGNDAPRQRGSILLLGLVMLALAGPPFWLTNVPISLGYPANRATLSFILGVSFLFAGLLEYFPRAARMALVVLAVSLAAGRQFLWANDFRRDWDSHKNLFWQMTWRVPGLEKDTVVLMNEELLYYADNSLSATLNWIYAPDNRTAEVDYVLFYPTNRLGASLPALTPDLPIFYDYLAGVFRGSTSQVVVFYYSPPGCLRVIDPDIDPANRLIPEDSLLREAAALSSTAHILNKPTAQMPAVYGPEPAHGWCYYFQKADLARQMGDWEAVTRLGDDAFASGDYPNDPVERFVFIEGYAHTEDWKKAVELSETSYKVSKAYVGPLLCKLWDRIALETTVTPEQASAVEQVRIEFECPP